MIMIDSNTRIKLSELKMDEFVKILESQESVPEFLSMPFDERLQFAISDYHAAKVQEKMETLVKKANFKYASVSTSSVDYLPERHLPKELILNLATCNFVGHATDIAVFGATGSGKSYLTCALGKAACMKGKRTLFYRMQDMLLDYDCIETPLQRKKFLKKLANYDLLIIDEWLGDSLNEKQLSFIYELVEKRTEVHSTIFCGQFSPKEWYARLGSSSKTESMLNRIFSGLCKVDCGDFNMREYLSSHKLVI